jgi:hypothetical protein
VRKFCRILYFLSLAPFILLCGCAGPTARHAFITHWPPSQQGGALRLAVKDNIDMAGVVTTAGSEYFAKNIRLPKPMPRPWPSHASGMCNLSARQT